MTLTNYNIQRNLPVVVSFQMLNEMFKPSRIIICKMKALKLVLEITTLGKGEDAQFLDKMGSHHPKYIL